MPTRRGALLLTLALLVHAGSAGGGARAQAKRGADSPGAGRLPVRPPAVIVGRGEAGLPPAVADMRAAILTAVETGDVAELMSAIELNEMKPDLGGPPGADPIVHLRSLSRDGTGTDVLSAIGRLLEGGWAAVHGGRDIENGRVYVWPHLAEIPGTDWSGDDEAVLEALVGPEEARTIVAARRYRGWRLSIGADGVWHTLTRLGP
jgi:hypothetical protein